MLRDFRALRVPEAREPKVSLRVFTSAAKRAVFASRALQSGLEREFLELLTEHGLAHEFEPQRSIAIDVAATAGAGRRSILTTADFAHCSLPYIVYLDGRMAHATERALANDNEISAELNRMGFCVRRFRSRHVSPSYRTQTVETIRRDLAGLSKAARQTLL